jgi:hypothetical protein
MVQAFSVRREDPILKLYSRFPRFAPGLSTKVIVSWRRVGSPALSTGVVSCSAVGPLALAADA